ncbi:dihydroneopterin aldolase [Ahrensia sp. AH-315-G08]|nr:dihydroneopterin aldolase [Ahrensia sp. AH-315-G08]
MATHTYEITLKNCAFFAHHGVYVEETKLGQRFFVDAKLKVEPKGALEEDRIEGTVHYGEAFAVIEAIVTGKNRYLIETLALDIAQGLCNAFEQITHAEITVRKPNAPVPGILDHVEVTVCHPEKG